jgi:FtsP/CotA-like multicopper oxidase with cupredoxin domain
MNMEKAIWTARLLSAPVAAMAVLFTATAYAAAPGITGTTFNLTAQAAYITQPDGAAIYSWGYGCSTGFTPTFVPGNIATGTVGCPTMQVPGPTLVVTQGQAITVNLTNNLPAAAGNTSILFPGFAVTSTGGVQGLLAQEAAPGGSVSLSLSDSSDVN